ncbi:50S ribosomal protein L29 [Patescibacteria group bacterium]|jgi:ribosomal protein L29|nr:50S ribosomal protein L29 [Patescibacteria group bacterium]
MKIKEYNVKFHKATVAEVEKEIITLENKVASLIFDHIGGKIKNVREAKKIRRDIARLKTILKERKNG